MDKLAYSANHNYREGYDEGEADGRDNAISEIREKFKGSEWICEDELMDFLKSIKG